MSEDCQHGTPGCDCYGLGYTRGKAVAHWEIRYGTSDHDRRGCGCGPCGTVRAIRGLPDPPADFREPPEFPIYYDAQGREHAEY